MCVKRNTGHLRDALHTVLKCWHCHRLWVELGKGKGIKLDGGMDSVLGALPIKPCSIARSFIAMRLGQTCYRNRRRGADRHGHPPGCRKPCPYRLAGTANPCKPAVQKIKIRMGCNWLLLYGIGIAPLLHYTPVHTCGAGSSSLGPVVWCDIPPGGKAKISLIIISQVDFTNNII